MEISVAFLSNNDRGNKRESFVFGQKIIDNCIRTLVYLFSPICILIAVNVLKL